MSRSRNIKLDLDELAALRMLQIRIAIAQAKAQGMVEEAQEAFLIFQQYIFEKYSIKNKVKLDLDAGVIIMEEEDGK